MRKKCNRSLCVSNVAGMGWAVFIGRYRYDGLFSGKLESAFYANITPSSLGRVNKLLDNYGDGLLSVELRENETYITALWDDCYLLSGEVFQGARYPNDEGVSYLFERHSLIKSEA